MLNKAYPLLSYLAYWLKKEDKFSLQSPFLFKIHQDLTRFLEIRKKEDLDIEAYRASLSTSDKIIEVTDFGAGSKRVNTSKRRVADITKFSTSSRKHAQLYQFFCSLTPASTVLELGTCMGISTRYLSKVTKGKLYTFEGSKEIWEVAQPEQGYENVTFVLGQLSQTLSETLRKLDQIDFALIDATHTYEGTIRYFEQIQQKTHSTSIVVIGDIHWSAEMSKAWADIKAKPAVKLSFDFYECGVVFFDFPGQKTEYTLDF
ncbi:class I SAM-dependent methyltransferase [Algoriphagus sp.]|uniref:O-methyltransferase n=1 Tax=Algoriphagus sp. TaxID=1872435 RepID=UPI00327A0123